MKLSLANLRKLKKEASPLQRRVYNYVISEWGDYEDKKNIFTDVLYHGCQSGTVGFLIYYSDTVRFYKQYKSEIDEMLYEYMSETDIYSLPELFGKKWDEEDPLGNSDFNMNLLAWFGFEETLRKIGYQFQELENYI